MSLRDAVQLARPRGWVKNGIVLLPVIFAARVDDPEAWWGALLAAVAFCLASSAVYIINDMQDWQSDRLHPRKKHRPLAAGRVSPSAALLEAGVLLAAGLAVGAIRGPLVVVTVLSYVLLQMVYTFYLKHKMLLDVMCIALGFVLRAAAGALAIPVVISPWLIVCTFTLCLFMGFCKRRNEIVTIGDLDNAVKHRPTLVGYAPDLLTHLITLSAAVAIMAFLVYASSSPERIGLMYTLPVFIYGVFRFAMLSTHGNYTDPTELILRDRPFQVTVIAWLALVMVVILWGRELQEWVERFALNLPQ